MAILACAQVSDPACWADLQQAIGGCLVAAMIAVSAWLSLCFTRRISVAKMRVIVAAIVQAAALGVAAAPSIV